MKSSEIFSLAVITRNHENFILETLESIRSQDYDPLELIVIDDKSDDETPNLVERWLKENKNRFYNVIFIVHDIHRGISYSHTEACKNSNGKYFKYIGGDDILLRDALKNMVEFLENGKQIGNYCRGRRCL